MKYLNSPLKVTGSLLMLMGVYIAIFTFEQFLFLGLSVIVLGVLLQVTSEMLFKLPGRRGYNKWGEIILSFFVLSFCGVLLLDYLGVIKIM